jgi:hypothetical protein
MGEPLSIHDAAKLIGKSTSTLRRWIKDGKVASVETDDGLQVDPAELERLGLIGAAGGRRKVKVNAVPTESAPDGQASDRLDALAAEVKELRIEVTKLRKQIELILVARMKRSPWWKKLF